MIIGFGFGSPLTSLAMLLVTSLVSYGIYRWVARRRVPRDGPARRAALRRYYEEQRRVARRMAQEFDVSDDEMEARINRELGGSDDESTLS